MYSKIILGMDETLYSNGETLYKTASKEFAKLYGYDKQGVENTKHHERDAKIGACGYW